MLHRLRYLLLQTRNPDDHMRQEEVLSFARALGCMPEQIAVFDLLAGADGRAAVEQADMVLLGGSGHYSATGQGEWLERALDLLRHVHDRRKPTFASCWGFQAMARAMGGRVVHDLSSAEVGTIDLWLTPQGQEDPIFAPLGSRFRAQAGHEDRVIQLPSDAILLASSAKVEQQAYRFADRPIYCTQFHPELNKRDLLSRVRAYPEYPERIAGLTIDQFADVCQETPEAEALLRRFVGHVFEEGQ